MCHPPEFPPALQAVHHVQIHVGLEKEIPQARGKAHLAYAVADLEAWRLHLLAHGIKILESIAIPGMERFECRDPFGNRRSFLKRL